MSKLLIKEFCNPLKANVKKIFGLFSGVFGRVSVPLRLQIIPQNICQTPSEFSTVQFSFASNPEPGSLDSSSDGTTIDDNQSITRSICVGNISNQPANTGNTYSRTSTTSRVFRGKEVNRTSPLAEKYPIKILVVEDNVTNRKVAACLLGKLGYHPEFALDGRQAAEKIRHTHFHLVFMDIQMPVLDGIDATRLIRSYTIDQPVIIAMTANSLDEDRQACFASGMNDFLAKPVSLSLIASTIEQWASRILDKRL